MDLALNVSEILFFRRVQTNLGPSLHHHFYITLARVISRICTLPHL